MNHEELLRLADEVFWIIVVLTWLFGSVCGMLLMFLLAPKQKIPLSDAEDWALRMADREEYRIDLTKIEHGTLITPDFTPEQLAEFKKTWDAMGFESTKLRVVK